MTDVKRLLEEAIQEHQGCACSGLYGHLRGRGIVVQVVNSLSAYEAAVSALERLTEDTESLLDSAPSLTSNLFRARKSDVFHRLRGARRVLRRLREAAS